MLIANYRGCAGATQDALLLARRWSQVAAVLFAVGAVSGTVLSFELGSAVAGADGPVRRRIRHPVRRSRACSSSSRRSSSPIYIYGWDRMRPWAHFWTGSRSRWPASAGTAVGGRRQRLDEPARRVHHAATADRRRATRSSVIFNGAFGTRPCTCCSPPTWSPVSRSPGSTRSACCGAAATATTGSAS